MRLVEDLLVVGVAVDGVHETALDAELVVQDFSYRSEAVGGAAGVADEDGVLGQYVVVDAHNNGSVDIVGLAGGNGEDDLLGAGVDVLHHLLAFLEETGALDNDVDTEFAPRQVLRVALSIDADLLAVDNEVFAFGVNFTVEVVVYGVVFEQISQGVSAGEVVDCYDFELGVGEHGAEGHSSDSAEAVDSYFYHIDLIFNCL